MRRAVFIFLLTFFMVSCANDLNQQLVQACKAGNIKRVKELLERGADINAEDTKSHFNCLMIACANGNLELVKELLKNGADINQKYKGIGDYKILDGHICLDFAIDGYYYNKSCDSVAEFLVSKGIDITIKKPYGITFLMLGAKNGMFKLVNALLEKGENINQQTPYGYTPLIFAVLGNKLQMVKLLLSHGADPNKKIKKGKYKGYTALKFAEEKGYKEIVSLLKEYGAKK